MFGWAAARRATLVGIDKLARERSCFAAKMLGHSFPVDRDRHRSLGLVDDDKAGQLVEDSGTPRPQRSELGEPVWSPAAVLPDGAKNMFGYQLGIAGPHGVEQLAQPVKPDRRPPSERRRRGVVVRDLLKITHQLEKRLFVGAHRAQSSQAKHATPHDRGKGGC